MQRNGASRKHWKNRIVISEISRSQKNNLLGCTSMHSIKIIRYINPNEHAPNFIVLLLRMYDFKYWHEQHAFYIKELPKSQGLLLLTRIRSSAYFRIATEAKCNKHYFCCIYVTLLRLMNHILWQWKMTHNSTTSKIIYNKVNLLPWSPYTPKPTE